MLGGDVCLFAGEASEGTGSSPSGELSEGQWPPGGSRCQGASPAIEAEGESRLGSTARHERPSVLHKRPRKAGPVTLSDRGLVQRQGMARRRCSFILQDQNTDAPPFRRHVCKCVHAQDCCHCTLILRLKKSGGTGKTGRGTEKSLGQQSSPEPGPAE